MVMKETPEQKLERVRGEGQICMAALKDVRRIVRE